MGLPAMLDTALDRCIVPGYSAIGLAVRRRLPHWPADPPRMDGKVVLVTGAGSGLGQAAAVGFARLGASVLALGRTETRAEQAAGRVRAQVPDGDVRPVACDLSSLASLATFIAAMHAAHDRLDVLVNNAGVMPERRELSADGVELTFATHVLAPWVLIDGLSPLLADRSAPGRVINVSSGGQYGQALPVGDPESTRDSYHPARFYARTKRAQLVITEQWADRLAEQGVLVLAMHPGWADTPGVRSALPGFRAAVGPFMRSPAQGADTIVWLGAAPEPLGAPGGFWHDRRARPCTHPLGPGADPDHVRHQLWGHLRALAGS